MLNNTIPDYHSILPLTITVTFYSIQAGWTPLHFAVYNSDLPTAQWLRREGADVNTANYVSMLVVCDRVMIVTNWYYSVVGEVIGGKEGIWGVIGVL